MTLKNPMSLNGPQIRSQKGPHNGPQTRSQNGPQNRPQNGSQN